MSDQRSTTADETGPGLALLAKDIERDLAAVDWRDGELAIYRTRGGGCVKLTEHPRGPAGEALVQCDACGAYTWDAEDHRVEVARAWAQQHADTCTALPRLRGGNAFTDYRAEAAKFLEEAGRKAGHFDPAIHGAVPGEFDKRPDPTSLAQADIFVRIAAVYADLAGDRH